MNSITIRRLSNDRRAGWAKFIAIVAFVATAALSINCNSINGDCEHAVGVAAARASYQEIGRD
jgi:hypothetical protein